MPDATIRPAQAEDLEAILDLWEELMHHHARLDPRFQPAEDARDVFRETMLEWIKDEVRRVLVAAKDDGELVGYAVAVIAENPPIYELRHYAHVSDICVAPIWRRRGLGRRLFAALRTWFLQRGVGVVRVSVAALNLDSLAFWRKMGFRDHTHRLWLDL